MHFQKFSIFLVYPDFYYKSEAKKKRNERTKRQKIKWITELQYLRRLYVKNGTMAEHFKDESKKKFEFQKILFGF